MSLTDWLQWAAIISVNIGVYWHMKAKDAHPDIRRELKHLTHTPPVDNIAHERYTRAPKRGRPTRSTREP